MAVHNKQKAIVSASMEGRTLGDAAPVAPSKPQEPRKKGRKDLGTIPVSTRLEPEKRDALEDHFRSQGLDLSTGIRQVLYEYIRSNRLGGRT